MLKDGTASARLRSRNIFEHDVLLQRAELSVFAREPRATLRELMPEAGSLLSRWSLRAVATEELEHALPLAVLGERSCRAQVQRRPVP